MYETVGELVRVDSSSSRKQMMKMERRIRRSSSVKESSSLTTKELVNKKFEAVDLSGMNLKSIPTTPSFNFNLGLISNLNLSNNNLQMIPESLIARLLNVVVLDVHSNQLSALPNSIGCLSKLKLLNVAGNNLEILPKTIENCSCLEELDANFNKLTRLPDTIGFELLNLKKLIVGSNKLVSLPSSTGHMMSLTHLDARLNCLQSLPEDLENLTNLRVLNVSHNFHHLKTLPYSIGLLLSLVELDVSYNYISVLPDSMGCLGKLKELRVEGNPLVSPSMEVVNRGLDAVRVYLSDKNMNNDHQSPGAKKKKNKTWRILRKLVSFNGGEEGCNPYYRKQHQDDAKFIKSRSYSTSSRSSSGGVFSPWRLFSPKSHHSV